MDMLFPQKELEYQSAKLFKYANQFIESTKCRNCGEKKRKAVGLYEYGDPNLPSQVAIFCPKCRRSDVFALRPVEEAMAFARMEKTGEKTSVVNGPIYKADDMIEYARLWNEAKLSGKRSEMKEKEQSIKDEAGKIIMNPDQVKKIDSKKGKR